MQNSTKSRKSDMSGLAKTCPGGQVLTANQRKYFYWKRFAQSAGPFGVIFAPLEPFLEHFGHTFCVQKQIGVSKAVQGAPKAATPETPSPFWTYFGTFFVIFLYVLIKKVGSEICYVFSLILGSPRALHGMGSHAVRTRLRSRNTFFRFCMFSKKLAPHDLILIPFSPFFWHKS